MNVDEEHEGEVDYDKEDEENDWLRIVSQAERPRLINYGMDFTECHCNVCRCEISKNDEHYHCFECKDFDVCTKCHSEGKIHLHGKENFLYKMTEPNWYFPIRILRDEKRTVSSVMMECFDFFQERHFVGFRPSTEDEDFTWYRFGQVREMMLRLARSMKMKLGLKRGDLISILCGIRLEPIIIWFSSIYLGITFVPLQSILSMEEKRYILKQTEVKVVFCGDENVNEIRELSKECTSIQTIVRISDTRDESTEEEHPTSSSAKEYTFNSMVEEKREKEDDDELPPPVDLKPEDIICIIYTSGTTGFAKGIVFRERVFLSKMTRKDHRTPLVIYSFLPLSHLSGILDPLLAFFNGGRTALLTESNMNFLFDDFKILRPTVLSTIPRVLNFVYAEYQRRVRLEFSQNDGDPKKRKEVEEKVRKEMKHIFGDRLPEITVGSAHCSNKVKKMVRKICQIPVYDGYGITEVGAVSYNYKASPDIDTKLLDCPELGYFTTDKPHPRGELLVRNKTTQSLEYFKNEEVSRKKFDEDGYFHTGDIVEKRGDRIILIDRKHNIIKMAQGEFLSLENVEKVLETSDYIDQIVLSPTEGNTNLMGLVTVQPSRWDGLKQKVETGEAKEEVMRDIESVGKRNEMNSWEFPSTIRLIFEKFPLTELKKKSRRKIVKKYEGLLNEMKLEISSKSSFQTSSSSTKSKTSDLEELMKNMGIRVDMEEVRRKNLRDLGVKSFTGVVLRNQIEQIYGVKLSFSVLMTKSISQILELLEEEEEGEEVSIQLQKKKFIDLEEEEEKFRKFMEEEILKVHPESELSEKMVTKPKSILLTGASGFLGSCLLGSLLREYPSSRIICLVRKGSEVSIIEDDERVKLLYGDLAQPYLGLEKNEMFRGTVDMIVHCGAMVNHFADYEEHYDANVRSLYDLVRISKGYKPFVYISSLSIFRSSMSRLFSIENQEFPTADGYAGSKWVADCLVRKFLSSSSLVVRPNLIIGDTNNGRCNHKDWMTAIIYACLDIKKVPILDDMMLKLVHINMLPVNHMADTIIRLMKERRMYKDDHQGKNFSFRNITAFELMEMILLQRQDEDIKIEKVTWNEWMRCLEERVDGLFFHPISPFLEGLRQNKGRFFGSSKFLEFGMSNYSEMFRKDWRKTSLGDVGKYVEYISKIMFQ